MGYIKPTPQELVDVEIDGWVRLHMTIRDLSEHEKAALKQGNCPFCQRSTTEFEARARGGLATNYYCPCGAGFNLAFFQGQYVAAELIAEPEKQPE